MLSLTQFDPHRNHAFISATAAATSFVAVLCMNVLRRRAKRRIDVAIEQKMVALGPTLAAVVPVHTAPVFVNTHWERRLVYVYGAISAALVLISLPTALFAVCAFGVVSNREQAAQCAFLKDNVGAIMALKKALRFPMGRAETHRLLAQSYLEANRWAPAIEQLRHALAIAPSAETTALLAASLEHQHSDKEAMQLYAKAVSMDVQNAVYAVAYADLLHKQGRDTTAYPVLQTAIHGNPGNPLPYIHLAAMLSDIGMYDESIANARRAVNASELMPLTHRCLGVALARAGLTYDAIPELQRAVELNPNYAQAYVDLSAAYVQLGKRRRAYQILKSCIAIQDPPADQADYMVFAKSMLNRVSNELGEPK